MPRKKFLLPHSSVRVKLTFVYSGLFAITGALMLMILIVFMSARTIITSRPIGVEISSPVSVEHGVIPVPSGQASSSPVPNGLTPRSAPVPSGLPFPTFNTQEQPPSVPAAIVENLKKLQTELSNQQNATVQSLIWASTLIYLLVVTFAIIVSWFLAGRVLRPLQKITNDVRKISETNLHHRLNMVGPHDEMKELGDTFDNLLSRLETAFESQKRFIANASHELRTPLARQRTIAQVAISDPEATVDSLTKAHERVLAAGDQQNQIITSLLALARSQSGIESYQDLDLAKIALDVFHSREPEMAASGITASSRLESTYLYCDPSLMERLITNLVDNAISHNIEHGNISLITETRGDDAVLVISNTGPVVPKDVADELLLPFMQMRSDRTGAGHGLGLSIVQAIVEAHKARLEIAPRTEGGLEITVSFPNSDYKKKRRNSGA